VREEREKRSFSRFQQHRIAEKKRKNGDFGLAVGDFEANFILL
jgi:hypothetical protein